MMFRSSRRHTSHSTGSLSTTTLAQLPSFPPPPAIPWPFVDREGEQEQALRLLTERGVVALTGARGSGKTALAAMLDRRSGLPSSWIELMPGLNDHVEPFLWQLARPLAQLAPDVWQALHQMQQADWEYPLIIRLQMILDGYARQPGELLLGIDGVEYIAEPALEHLLIGLCDYVSKMRHTKIKLLIIGTALPYRLERYALPALHGLTPDALMHWANELSLVLNREQVELITRQTGGLPQAITLLLATLREHPHQWAAASLIRDQNIRHFVAAVLSDLPADARALLEQLASQPDQLVALPRDVRAQLTALEERHLATISADGIAVHPLIRSFHQHDSIAG